MARLRDLYGPPRPLPTSDPFELILLENIAYLASPGGRRAAFALLKRSVGTRPAAILAAGREKLEAVTAHGILGAQFAEKLRECARIAASRFGGDLTAAIDAPLAAARRALRSFPGIGEPAAEKVLLFSGRQALLAPDSNALRVLVRLGFVEEGRSYARTYAASREAALGLTRRPAVLQEAHLLLQQHGRELCRRQQPRCGACPLARGCGFAGGHRTRRAGVQDDVSAAVGSRS